MATKAKCPSGYTLKNGKCTDAYGNIISAPYVSEKGALYPDEKSLTTGCAKNPNGPGCKEVINKMTPEQRAKIKGIQKLGGSTKKYKKGGAIKKYEVGGMTESESCGKPGKPRCKKTFKSKGKSKETKGSLLGTIGAGILGSLGGYAAYKKYKQQKGGATKYQKGGASDPIKAMYKAKGEKMPTTKETLKYVSKNGSGYIPSNKSSKVDTTKWKERPGRTPDAKKYQNGGTPTPPPMTRPVAPQMPAPKPKARIVPPTPKPQISGKGDKGYTRYTGTGKPSINAADFRAKVIERYGSEEAARAAKAIQKKGGSTYKTGGMVNPNAKLQAAKVAGSKGVKSGVNPKAAASKVARGRSGGTSTAPKKATPGRK